MAEGARGAESGRQARRGDIQGLRAVAVLLVVIYHSGIALPGGYIGVDVFFVISGYVITRMLINELEVEDRIDLRRFYLRRIRRLLPALGLMLSVTMLSAVLLAPIGGQQITARTGAAAALLNANSYLIRFGEAGYFDVGSEVNALLHTWSLSVEEQFYLVFPALLLAAWTIGRKLSRQGGRPAVGAALSSIALVSFAVSWALTYKRTEALGIDAINDLAAQIAFYSAPTRAWQFAVGGLLVLAPSLRHRLTTPAATVLAATGASMVLVAAVRFDGLTPFPGLAALVPTTGTLLFLVAGDTIAGNPLSRGLATRPAQYLGDMSYSWYLWHWPCIVFASALWPNWAASGLAGAAFSLLPGWLAYRYVENPIRFAPRPRPRRTAAIAVACVALPVMASASLDAGHRWIEDTEQITSLESALSLHADVARGCDALTPIGEREGSDCTWGNETPSGELVLIGDSNAGHFTEGFVGAASELGLSITVATYSSCPFVDLVLIRDGERSDRCRQFASGSLEHLVEAPPDVVVIAYSNAYVESDRFAIEVAGSNEHVVDSDAKAELWEPALAETVKRLEAAGIGVALVHTAPHFLDWDLRECAALRLLSGSTDSCGTSIPLKTADERRERTIAAELAVADLTGLRTLDIAPLLCPNATCQANIDGTWNYRDGTHISIDASKQLASTFADFLRPLVPDRPDD